MSEIVAGSRVEIVAENQVGAQWTSGGEVGVFVGIRSQVELQSKRAGPRMDQGDLHMREVDEALRNVMCGGRM